MFCCFDGSFADDWFVVLDDGLRLVCLFVLGLWLRLGLLYDIVLFSLVVVVISFWFWVLIACCWWFGWLVWFAGF